MPNGRKRKALKLLNPKKANKMRNLRKSRRKNTKRRPKANRRTNLRFLSQSSQCSKRLRSVFQRQLNK